MTKNKSGFLFAALPLILTAFLMSCASTETSVEKEPTEKKPEVVSMDSSKVTEARTKADTAKNTAVDAGASKAAPQEYEAAEALYAAGVEAENSGDIDKAFEAFTAAESAYNNAVTAVKVNKEAALSAMSAADNALAQVEKNAEEAVLKAQEEAQ